METWLIYAIASIFMGGIYSFQVKVAAHKNYNPSMVTGYGYLSGSVLSGMYFIYQGLSVINFWIIFGLALVNTIFYFLSTLTRMESMKNIDSVIFFPIFKTVWPILATLVWLFMFHETLTRVEILWIFLWIVVPLMLITVHENTRQKNLKKGILLLVLTALLTIVSLISLKQIHILHLDVSLFLFLSMTQGYFISVFSHHMLKKKHKYKKYNTKNMVKFGVCMGLFQYISFYCFTQALSWNLAIVFTINSFAILIPIILSVIFYKEHFNMKKAFVIALSVVSILLFI